MSLGFEITLKPAGRGLLWAFLKVSDEKASGILTLEWERFRKQIVFRRGEPVHSKSNWPAEAFASFLVRKQVLAQSVVQEQLKQKEAQKTKEPLGEFLVRNGFVEGPAMGVLLSEHFQDRVFNLLSLSHGQVQFEAISEEKLDSIEKMQLSDSFRKLLWGHVKQAFTESVCRAKLAAYITRKGKLKGQSPLPLAPGELRLWNDLSSRAQAVNELTPLGLQFFSVASEFELIDWADSDEEVFFKEMSALLERFKSQKSHEILGIEAKADPSDCKKVYLSLVKKYHPDRLPPSHSVAAKKVSEMLFARINEAYSTMTDEEKRKEYLASIELEEAGGHEKVQAHLEAEMAIPQAKMALRRRHFKGAFELYKSIVAVLKDDGEVVADAAYTEMMMLVESKADYKSKLSGFRDTFSRALTLRKDYADALYYRGMAWKLDGQDQKAEADFDRALDMNPKLNEAASESRLLKMRKEKKSSGIFGKKS